MERCTLWTRVLSEVMSYRKNATTLVIRNPGFKRKRYSSLNIARNSRRRPMLAIVPRSQSSLLSQPSTGDEKKAVGVRGAGVLLPTAQFNTNGINLLPITLGNGPGAQRIGRKIRLRSIALRYGFEPDTTAACSQMRIVVVYDKQPSNNGPPLATTVFDNNQFYSPLNLNSSERFVCVMDEISECATSQDLIITGKRFVRINLDTIFGANNGLDTDITTGALWAFACHNDWITTAGANTFIDFRTRYTDV